MRYIFLVIAGFLTIAVLVISKHLNITDPIETAGAQQIAWLSRGLVISEVGIWGTNCISLHLFE